MPRCSPPPISDRGPRRCPDETRTKLARDSSQTRTRLGRDSDETRTGRGREACGDSPLPAAPLVRSFNKMILGYNLPTRLSLSINEWSKALREESAQVMDALLEQPGTVFWPLSVLVSSLAASANGSAYYGTPGVGVLATVGPCRLPLRVGGAIRPLGPPPPVPFQTFLASGSFSSSSLSNVHALDADLPAERVQRQKHPSRREARILPRGGPAPVPIAWSSCLFRPHASLPQRLTMKAI